MRLPSLLALHSISCVLALRPANLAGFERLFQTPCIYVMTFDRPDSLVRLLNQINEMDFGADSGHVRLTISVDHARDDASPEVKQRRGGSVDAANRFDFHHGEKVVQAQSSHLGLIKQWLNAWTPDKDDSDTRQACLILEDDLLLSQFAWTWIREALTAYGNKTDRIASFGLQRPTLVPAVKSSRGLGKMPPDNVGRPFLYKLMSSWGFVALRTPWTDFRKWMEHNFVEGHPSDVLFEGSEIIPSTWHKSGPSHMWTYWFIRFMDERNLFTLYSNIAQDTSLCSNMKEPGLHFSGKAAGPMFKPLESDVEELHNFPDLKSLTWYAWDAQPVA